MKPNASQPDPLLLGLCDDLVARLDGSQHVAAILTQDEVAEWPAGFLGALEAGGIMTSHTPVERVLCLGCEEACFRPIERLGGQRNVIICHLRNDMLPMPVEPERMQRWRLAPSALAGKLSAVLAQGGAQEVMEGRIWHLGKAVRDGKVHNLFLFAGVNQPDVVQVIQNNPIIQQAANPMLITLAASKAALPIPSIPFASLLEWQDGKPVYSREKLALLLGQQMNKMEAVKSWPGAKPRYPWDVIKIKFAELLGYNGPPSWDDPELRNQAAVEAHLLAWCEQEFGRCPSESTMRRYVVKWLKEREGS